MQRRGRRSRSQSYTHTGRVAAHHRSSLSGQAIRHPKSEHAEERKTIQVAIIHSYRPSSSPMTSPALIYLVSNSNRI
ncbi:hypothetical protein BJV82DRAFT_348658 [Fennellomyces sp. T-0311]|nr:hypothetical protein BJV82DRAFT_348658 [Fennellomyces sp. T-0311]